MSDKPQKQKHGAFAKAMCLDLPYIVDSVWRRAEFNFNRLADYGYAVAHDGTIKWRLNTRTFWHVPQFWFFVISLIFVAYGPTFDALCSVAGDNGMSILRGVFGVTVILAALVAWGILGPYGTQRAQKRFDKAGVAKEERWRRGLVNFMVQSTAAVVCAAVARFGLFVFEHRLDEVCRKVPSNAPAWGQLLLLLGVIILASILSLRPRRSLRRLLEQAILLLGMGLLLWLLIAPAGASEANQTPYLHNYGVGACLLALLACLAYPLAGWLFGTVSHEQRELYKKQLTQVELFPGSRVDPEISPRRVGAALFTGMFYNLAEFLLLPAVVGLLTPSRWLLLSTCIALGVSGWLMMMGNLTSRWQAMISQVRRWFLVGTPMVVSLGVIGIAVLRLAKVQYVTTVLDAAPFGVLFVWIVMAYCLLWWFEIVINTAVARELFEVIGNDEDIAAGYIKYEPDNAELKLNVEASHRYLTVHGSGRFVALGWFKDKDSQEPTMAFQTFDLVELFAALTPDMLADLWHDLKRRIQLYFLTINGLIAAMLFATSVYYGWGDRHNTVEPVVTAQPTSSGPHANLAELLKDSRKDPTHDVYVVAASGGGTRAALFTATALRGLHRLGVDRHIVLLSGVSGGGVAEAYFYSHRAALIKPNSDEDWDTFEERMTDPFIGDVLEGAGESRLMSDQPLGKLLAESFERRLFNINDGQATLGLDPNIGLILNSTITAHPATDSDLLRDEFKHEECCLDVSYALMGGGRMIFTNLADQTAFPASGSTPPGDDRLHIPDVRLPYVVIGDGLVPVASAAALNANFPPVFTNARVQLNLPDDSCPVRTYYVTDGGATENLGLLSALYALRGALEQIKGTSIPPVHIVTIEASATTYDYKPDRGIDAATGGSKERITGGLTQELLDTIDDLTRSGDHDHKVHLHHLALPLAFRSRGGFGTHWMFPESIVVENPRNPQVVPWYQHLWAKWVTKNPSSAVLEKCELEEMWKALYEPDKPFCTADWHKPDETRIAGWICGDREARPHPLLPDIQLSEWQELAATTPHGTMQERKKDCQVKDIGIWPKQAE